MNMRKRLNSAVYPIKRSAIREFSRMARETPGCVALTLGEPDFDTPAEIVAGAIEAFDRGETHYIENNGLRELRVKTAEFERSKNGLTYDADEIIITAGATEALWVALFGIIEPGDEVIVPTPAFGLYAEIIRMCRGTVVELDTSDDGFQISASRLASLVNDRTKAIILNSPNNPTGCIYTEESLAAVLDIVRGHDIFVICDDVYRQLRYTDDYRSFAEYGSEFPEIRDKIIVVQSYSKPYAMTGWRMGYLLADVSIKERLELVHQYTVVSTPAPFQRSCLAALDYDPKELVETYRRRREFMLARLEEIGLSVTEPKGAFYVFPSIEKFGIGSAEFCTRMIKEAGLAATPGFCFGSDRHIRLTYCYSDSELREGLNRLERFVNGL